MQQAVVGTCSKSLYKGNSKSGLGQLKEFILTTAKHFREQYQLSDISKLITNFRHFDK